MVFQYYLNACRQVVHSPHLRYEGRVYGRRAESIRRWTPRQVNRFAAMDRDRREVESFRVESLEGTIDTQENRFVLWTLEEMTRRLSAFADELDGAGSSVSSDYVKRIREQCAELGQIAKMPFFKRVGHFKGFREESQVLQKRPGYAQIYSAWLTLKKGLEPVGNDVDAGYRPISALYEFWCFLTIRNILKEDFGDPIENGVAVDWSKILDCDKDDDGSLAKMDVVFQDSRSLRTITLSYQKSYGVGDDVETFAMLNSQRPDIVLSIREEGGGVFTYLFDAKYRIVGMNGKDGSPREAIDDVHRYCDAILYRAGRDGLPSHEMIGAYVLFPGRPIPKSYDYNEVIEAENIGGIPLLPGEEGETALRGFVSRILKKRSATEHLRRAIAPRGASIKIGMANVLVVRTDRLFNIVKLKMDGSLHYIRKKITKGARFSGVADYLLVIERDLAVAVYCIESVTFTTRRLIGIDFLLSNEERIEDSPILTKAEYPDGVIVSSDIVFGMLHS